MTLQEVIDELGLKVLTSPKPFAEMIPSGGYCSDLLSCVMAGAKHGGLWITLQAHVNIVAVAALLDLVAVIISEGAMPDEGTLRKAEEQGITLLASPLPSYAISGRLWEMGLKD